MKRVLLVDDQGRWRDIFKAILKQKFKDLEIQECTNMEDTLEILEEQVFDLAIIDLRLVDESNYNVQGLALVRQVKAKSPETKVILVTAYPAKVEGKNQEADAFIRKVSESEIFDIKLFQDTVNNLINCE
ncbi:MAG: response regulator [Leptolyngbyaceae cyanobacterium MO_188.B28]|nr:response regulator [Leptolyngbyaceae cyanobacterium MO_188.B28]